MGNDLALVYDTSTSTTIVFGFSALSRDELTLLLERTTGGRSVVVIWV